MTSREFTHPDVFTRGVAEGWAEPITDPTLIDWSTRQSAAAIPFKVVNGRPVNPCQSTGIQRGRNELGHWGEAQAADALVSAYSTDGHRFIVAIIRSDDRGLALPGGYLDVNDQWLPIESPLEAAPRELAEETRLILPGVVWAADPPRYVPDPRGSDESWMVTTLVRADLGTLDTFPAVTGADDAQGAVWAPASAYEDLSRFANSIGERIFSAHITILREVLA